MLTFKCQYSGTHTVLQPLVRSVLQLPLYHTSEVARHRLGVGRMLPHTGSSEREIPRSVQKRLTVLGNKARQCTILQGSSLAPQRAQCLGPAAALRPVAPLQPNAVVPPLSRWLSDFAFLRLHSFERKASWGQRLSLWFTEEDSLRTLCISSLLLMPREPWTTNELMTTALVHAEARASPRILEAEAGNLLYKLLAQCPSELTVKYADMVTPICCYCSWRAAGRKGELMLSRWNSRKP